MGKCMARYRLSTLSEGQIDDLFTLKRKNPLPINQLGEGNSALFRMNRAGSMEWAARYHKL